MVVPVSVKTQILRLKLFYVNQLLLKGLISTFVQDFLLIPFQMSPPRNIPYHDVCVTILVCDNPIYM